MVIENKDTVVIPTEEVIKNRLHGIYMFNLGLFDTEHVELNTNVMVSGSNGAGKTTFSSFLAFFATGQIRSFHEHNKKSKSSTFDYFFAYETSFLVYEYKNEDYNVLVAVYSKDNVDELEMRFIAVEDEKYDVVEIFNKDTREEVLNEIDRVAISSMKIRREDYTKVLYGQHTKEAKPYMFSHVRNYPTFTRLYYASFSNAKIDTSSIKNIIVEYAQAKSESNSGGASRSLNLENHEKQLGKFRQSHSAIMEWENNYPTLGRIKDNLLKMIEAQKQRENVLLKMRRETFWYEELLEEYQISQETQNQTILDLKTDMMKLNKDHIQEESEAKVKEKKSRDAVSKLEGKKDVYDQNKELMGMISEISMKEKLEGDYESVLKTLKVLQEKVGDEEEKHKKIISDLEGGLKREKTENQRLFDKVKSDFLQIKIVKDQERRDRTFEVEKEYPSTVPLEEKQSSKKQELSNMEIESKKISAGTPKDDSRCQALYKNKEELGENLTTLTREAEDLASKKKIRIQEEESFLISLRHKNENEDKKTQDELDVVNKKIERLNRITEGEDTLYAQIKKTGLDPAKYTSILNEDALESLDFEPIDTETNCRHVLDFQIKNTSLLLNEGESIFVKIKNLKKERDDIKLRSKKRKEKISEERKAFYKTHNEVWKKLIDRDKEVSGLTVSLKDELSDLGDIVSKAELFFNDEKTKAIDEKSKIINGLRVKVHELGLEIDRNKQAKQEALDAIEKETVYDEKAQIKIADNERTEKNERADDAHEKLVETEKERYKKVLKGACVSEEETSPYIEKEKALRKRLEKIRRHEQGVSDYHQFMEYEWISIESLRLERKIATKALEYLSERQLKESEVLSKKLSYTEDRLSELDEKSKTATRNKKLLDDTLTIYVEELIEKEDLAPKSNEEKRETNLEEEASNLIAKLQKKDKDISDSREEINMTISKKWSRFIAMEVIPMESDYLANARRLIQIEEDRVMINFKETTFQKINLSISSISGYYDVLEQTYDEVKNAISKINKDLIDISSTKLIESIELKEMERGNGIHKAIQDLASYWKENQFKMQENLFSTEYSNKYRDDAMKMLDRFMKKLAELSYKDKLVSVGSVFDLHGRVIEKGQRTEWGDRVFNTGSEGTQLLIKTSIMASLFSMALAGSKDEMIPYMMIDEIGKLDIKNVERILGYINSKSSFLVALQPNNNMAKYFDRAYEFNDISKESTVIKEYLRKKSPLVFKEEADAGH